MYRQFGRHKPFQRVVSRHFTLYIDISDLYPVFFNICGKGWSFSILIPILDSGEGYITSNGMYF